MTDVNEIEEFMREALKALDGIPEHERMSPPVTVVLRVRGHGTQDVYPTGKDSMRIAWSARASALHDGRSVDGLTANHVGELLFRGAKLHVDNTISDGSRAAFVVTSGSHP